MTIKNLDSIIAKAEGGKLQSHIGNVRETRRILAELCVNDPEMLYTFLSGAMPKHKGAARLIANLLKAQINLIQHGATDKELKQLEVLAKAAFNNAEQLSKLGNEIMDRPLI